MTRCLIPCTLRRVCTRPRQPKSKPQAQTPQNFLIRPSERGSLQKVPNTQPQRVCAFDPIITLLGRGSSADDRSEASAVDVPAVVLFRGGLESTVEFGAPVKGWVLLFFCVKACSPTEGEYRRVEGFKMEGCESRVTDKGAGDWRACQRTAF